MAEFDRNAKARELADIAGEVPSLEVAVDEKEKDLKKALLDSMNAEHLLGLVMRRHGWLNPQVVRGTCERFIRTTYMKDLFYVGCWWWFKKKSKTLWWMFKRLHLVPSRCKYRPSYPSSCPFI